jgi:hypothetical protein
MDVRGVVPFPSQQRQFRVAISAYVQSRWRHPNKNTLRELVQQLRNSGLSVREIAAEVGLHWTRVGQLVKQT